MHERLVEGEIMTVYAGYEREKGRKIERERGGGRKERNKEKEG